MAVYFKCPKCGLHFIDYFGENAKYDTEDCYKNGPYTCPDCDSDAISITEAEMELYWRQGNKVKGWRDYDER